MVRVDIEIVHGSTKEKICLHLLEVKALQVPDGHPTKLAGPERTQEGIAEVLGFSNQRAAVEIKEALRRGELAEDLCHIDGQKRRKIAYSLTYKGVQVAEKVKQRVECQTRFDREGGFA